MKTVVLVPIFFSLGTAAFGQAVKIDIRGELAEGSFDSARKETIFHGQVLVPFGQLREVFTGPYSIRVAAAERRGDSLAISIDFFGLGPEFKALNYTMHPVIGDTIYTPPLEVRDSTLARYTFAFVDDTSRIDQAEPSPDDTTSWGISETVHYRTHWLKGSLADYMWNLKMGYLEQIYDRHRHGFSLSSSEKIDLFFHPRPTNQIYLDPQSQYSFSPRQLRIDAEYSHAVDAVSPRMAIELLLYREWGYAPYWMVSGFGGFYSDNFLRLRKLSRSFSPASLASLLGDKDWVAGDTGQIVTGGLVRWLLDKNTITRFMSLYKASTELDFGSHFRVIYGKDFESALDDFLEFARNYKPQEGELEYYASLYMDQGNYHQARQYLEEIVNGREPERQKFRKTLAICQYWMGNYSEAANTLGADAADSGCADKVFLENLRVADGAAQPVDEYAKTAHEQRCGEAIVNLSTYHLDNGQLAAAETLLASADSSFMATPEYLIARGRLNLMEGQAADSELNEAANIALSRAETVIHDPVNYLVAGQAYLLIGDYAKAEENLETSYFLERRPYFQGLVLLELGKLFDLEGKRDDAKEYYGRVLAIDAGAYEKSLAQKYLERKFSIKP